MSELNRIYNKLSRIFSSRESFEKHFNKRIQSLNAEQWGDELKSELYMVHEFLKGHFSENETPRTETVRLWINKIEITYDNAKLIKRYINEIVERSEANRGIPEGYYPSEMLEAILRETKKGEDELYQEISEEIEGNLERYSPLLPFAESSEMTLKFVLDIIKKTFKPILVLPNATNQDKRNKENNGTDWPKPKSKNKRVPNIKTFECYPNKKELLPKIHAKAVSSGLIECTKSDFLLLFSGEVSGVKIDWKKNLNQLHYFVDCLIKKGVIDKDCNKWQIAENYLTNKSETILDKLQGSNVLNSKTKRKEIDDLFS